MLQTVLIIIHLILIAIAWYIVGYILGKKYELKLKYEFAETSNKKEISIINRKLAISIIVGICLNLGIIYWLISNIKPAWYGNYVWFITLVPVSIFIALVCALRYPVDVDGIIVVVGFICIGFISWGFTSMFIGTPGEPVETTTRIDIANVNDSKEVTGSVSGGGFLIYSVNGSVSTDNVYNYYYQQEDGGFKLANIPADKSTIYYLPEGETKGYINKITTTTYYYDNNNYPAVKTDEVYEQSCKYEIYVPEGSIGTYYEFNGE